MIEVNAQNAATAAQVLKAFLAEFPAADVKIKPAIVKGNRCLALHYVDARLVMDRLDEVVGVDGWQDAYTVLPTGEVECRLSVRIAGQWVTKADVGGQSEQPDEGDRMKAAYSDALKRAAVKFGIGRFLYRMPQEWMDYDPVRKQVVRPGAAPAVPLYERAMEAIRTAAGRDALTAIYRQVEADVKAGRLTKDHEAGLLAAFKAAAAKFPVPPQPAGAKP